MSAPQAEFQQAGKPIAQPVYLVENTAGNPISSTNGLSVSVASASDNQRVNAQSGDFVAGAITDLATYLTLAGTPTDANTVTSLMGRLTKIRDLLSATIAVSGTFWQATQPVSAASLPLPSGAAKETGGNLDNLANILTQVTNHTVTANAGTNLNTSLLALESGGNLASLLAGLGAIGDVAWSLSGNGDTIAILKKVALLLNAGLSITSLPALATSTNTIGNVGFSGCGYSAVAVSSSPTTVKNASGVFFGAIVTTIGASMATIYDSTSGNILAQIPASSAVGFSAAVPATGIKFGTSLVVSGSATNPAIMVYYS